VAVGPPPATDPHYEDDFEKKILELVNKERKTAGLNPVKSSQGLNDAAQVRARELTESFSHTRPNGSAYDTAIKIPYMVSGENIAIGQKTPQQVMEAWMNSPGHRDNILNPYWTIRAVPQCAIGPKFLALSHHQRNSTMRPTTRNCSV